MAPGPVRLYSHRTLMAAAWAINTSEKYFKSPFPSPGSKFGDPSGRIVDKARRDPCDDDVTGIALITMQCVLTGGSCSREA